MRSKYIIPLAVLLPLVVVIVLALFGITLNIWLYIVLAIGCPLVAGVVWFIYKDMERKITDARRGMQR